MTTERADEIPITGGRELLVTGATAFGIVFLATVLYFGTGVLLGRRLFFAHDIAGADLLHLYYPFWHHAAESVGRGELPLWCANLGTGFPLLAEAQVGALYPSNLLLRALLPLPLAFNLSTLLHLGLAGALAAAFARSVGAGRGGSFFSGLVYALGGFFLVHVRHPNLVAATVWFPLLLLLVDAHVRRRRRWIPAAVGTVVALSFLAGHPQMTFYGVLMAGLYASARLVRVWRRGPDRDGGLPVAGRTGLGLVFGVLLGGLLAAPQLLPTWELKRLGPRSEGLSLEQATLSQYEFRHLLLWVLPKAYGDPGELRPVPVTDPLTGEVRTDPRTGEPIEALEGWRGSDGGRSLFWAVTTYLGLLPLLLIVPALLPRRKGPPGSAWLVLVLVVVSLLLALGTTGGLFTLLYQALPGFDLFRFPSRFLVFAAFGVAILAGLGLTRVLLLVPDRRRELRPVLAAAALAIGFLDLRLALHDQNPTIEAERWTTAPNSAQLIRAETKASGAPFRMVAVDPGRRVFLNAYERARGWKGDLTPYDAARTMLDPNLSLLYGVNNLLIYTPSPVRWAEEGTSLLFPPPGPRAGRAPVVRGMLCSLFNVRFLIDPYGLLLESRPVLAELPGDVWLEPGGIRELLPFRIRVHENPQVLPRAFLVPRSRIVPSRPFTAGRRSQAQAEILSPGFDPREEVLLSADTPPPPFAKESRGGPIPDAVEVVTYEDQRVVLHASAPRDCWLFLSDTFYPGWEAKVDGVEVRIHRANVCGRAVWLSAGNHRVEFVYRPGSFRLGLLCFVLGLVLMCVAPILRRWQRSRAGEPPGLSCEDPGADRPRARERP